MMSHTVESSSSHAVSLSIIIPVYNEAPNLAPLLEKIAPLAARYADFELILIDDGSEDESVALLRDLCRDYPWLTVVQLTRNYGQSAAMTAGFQHARGEIIVSMDGDLQNDPDDVPRLLDKLAQGYDVVCGWRKKRQDAWHRTGPSRIANALIASLTGVRLHDYGCSLKAYRRAFVEDLILYGELHRFIPVLTALDGARIAEIEVQHHPRRRGVSKYGISRTPKVLLDLLLMYYFQRFATRPLHFFGRSGLLLGVIGVGIELYLTARKLFWDEAIGTRPLLLLGALLILSGILLVGIGILAELIIRIYHETGERRIYTIRTLIRHGAP